MFLRPEGQEDHQGGVKHWFQTYDEELFLELDVFADPPRLCHAAAEM